MRFTILLASIFPLIPAAAFGGQSEADTMLAVNNTGVALLQRGACRESAEPLNRAVAVTALKCRPRHACVGLLVMGLAQGTVHLREHEQAHQPAFGLPVAHSDPQSSSVPASQEEALRLTSNGQFAEALRVLGDLIEDAERAGSPPGYKAGLFHLLGMAQNRLGRYEEAKAALNRGLQASDHIRQTAPELTIALLVEAADADLNQGHTDEAYRGLVRAWAIASKGLAPGHPRLGSVQHSLGVLFWVQGNLSRAEKAFRLALTILENSLGPGHADVAATASGLAGLLTMTRRQAEAIPLLEQSKVVFERLYGPAHPDTISATFALGTALIKFAPAEAELMLRGAIENWRASQPERHPHMIGFLAALAASRHAQGDYREAGTLSGRALQMSQEVFGPEHPHAITQMYKHAQLLKDSRRRREATALKKEADRIRAKKGYGERRRHQIDILALR